MLFQVSYFRKRVRVGFRPKVVYYPSHQLVPFSLVIFPEVVSDFNDEFVQLLDPTIDVTLLGVSNRSELVLFFYYFGEVPKLRGPTHILPLERVIQRF